LVTAALAVAWAGMLVASPSTSVASTSDEDLTGAGSHSCGQQLDAAAERDMQTFANFEADAWRAMHHPDAISVLTSGHILVGVDAIMTALNGHFVNKNATWEYQELSRAVDRCRSAYILYETTYAIPSSGLEVHALTGVSWTREHGQWLVIGDQGTLIDG
jgi:hypothetical protein